MKADKLDFKEVGLGDKPLFDEYFSQFSPEHTLFSFATLYIWRNVYKLRYCHFDDSVVIVLTNGRYSETSPLVILTCTERFEERIATLILYYKNLGGSASFLLTKEECANKFTAAFGDSYNVTEERDNFQYIYETEKMILLSGSRYHQKRNWVNRFKNSFDYSVEALTDENAQECMELFLDKFNNKSDDGYLETVLADCFANHSRIGFKGMVLRVSGDAAGFALGGVLSPEMAYISQLMANTEFAGAYPFLMQAFIQEYFSGYQFVNLEEDLGIPGLRKSKLSYHPIRFAADFVAVEK